MCPEQGAGWPRALKKDTVSLMLIKDVMGLPLALTMIHPTHCRQMRRAPRVAGRDACSNGASARSFDKKS